MNKRQSMRRSRFPFESGRVAPEIFQTVEGTFVAVKDVNHYFERRDRAQVEDDNLFRLFVGGEFRTDSC